MRLLIIALALPFWVAPSASADSPRLSPLLVATATETPIATETATETATESPTAIPEITTYISLPSGKAGAITYLISAGDLGQIMFWVVIVMLISFDAYVRLRRGAKA